jgi:hypothetical protein
LKRDVLNVGVRIEEGAKDLAFLFQLPDFDSSVAMEIVTIDNRHHWNRLARIRDFVQRSHVATVGDHEEW